MLCTTFQMEARNNGLWEFSFFLKQWRWLAGDPTTWDTIADNYTDGGWPSSRLWPRIVCHKSKQPEIFGEKEIFLFGGNSVLSRHNDLWKYSITDDKWYLLAGSKLTNVADVFGPIGDFTAGAWPGGRHAHLMVNLNDERFAIFGGSNWDDKWDNHLYLIETGNYTAAYMFGTSGMYDPVLVSPKNVYNSSNVIGGRHLHSGWSMSDDEFFVFGGSGRGLTGNGYLGDLWVYSIALNSWKYVSGYNDAWDDSYINTRLYPDMGVPLQKKPKKYPINRHSASTIFYDDFIFVFGGYVSFEIGYGLHDLLMYDTINDDWYFVYGKHPRVPYSIGNNYYHVANLPVFRNSAVIAYDFKSFGSDDEFVLYITNGVEGSGGSSHTGDFIELKQQYTCYGELWSDVNTVCSSHGICNYFDECICTTDYKGHDCSISYCGDHLSNTSDACSGKGFCVNQMCHCIPGFLGDDCEYPVCYGKISNDTDVCSGHGKCQTDNKCHCNKQYQGELCDSCINNYGGDSCNTSICHGHLATSNAACSGHGMCQKENKCKCLPQFVGEFCDSCVENYGGKWCNVTMCNGHLASSNTSCSAHGLCNKNHQCKCNFGWEGESCSARNIGATLFVDYWYLTWVLIIIILLIIAIIVVIVVSLTFTISKQRKTLKKVEEIGDIDILLEEKRLEENSIAHLKINKKLFEIDYKDVKLLKRIGSGGSETEVFLVEWKNQNAVLKVFRNANSFTKSQENFESFEKEVSIISSVSHPNILTFFGAILNEKRVGIVMEYAKEGEIGKFFVKFKELNKFKFPIAEKIRMIKEICYAMSHLHSLKIIHRDLKSENVLIIEKSLTAKVMDFGISKIVSNDSQDVQTRRVGTSFYMAPEMITSSSYDYKVDVYSFGILLYVLLSENLTNPFGLENNNSFGVEIKVSKDHNFRPKISPEVFEDVPKWLVDLMKQCWQHQPVYRPSFTKIIEIIKNRSEMDKNEEKQIEVKKDVNDDGEKKIIESLKKENEELKNRLKVIESELKDLKKSE